MPNYVPGMGDSEAKLLILGEAPGEKEDASGKPFVGPAGEILDDILESAGIHRSRVWLTNVYKYRPPFNKIYRIKEVIPDPHRHIEEVLYPEIREINPNCILALGNTALKAVCPNAGKITDYRGSILLSPTTGRKVVGTFHPASFFNRKDREGDEGAPVSYSYKYIAIEDCKRAIQESLSSSYDIPRRRIEIARDAITVERFFDFYKDEHYVSVDIEVIRAIPVSISFAYNSTHAIVFPLVSLGKLQANWNLNHAELALMQYHAIQALNRVKFVIGQNFKFDQVKLENTMLWKKFLQTLRDRVLDITIFAHALYPEYPKKLAFLTSIFTREPFYKHEGKEFNYKKQDFKDFFIYNGKDACVQYEIFFKVVEELKGRAVPNFPNWYDDFVWNYLRHLHDFYKDIDEVGLLVDKDIKKKYFDKYTEIYQGQRERLNELAGFDCNPHSSVKDVPILLYRELQLPKRKDTSRQTLVALLNNVAKKPRQKECIELVLASRRTRKARNTYYGAELDYDGRMRTSYNPNGTETGRSSTQILKPPVRPFKVGIAFQTMTKHGDIGHELREMFIPDDGFCFIEIDLSQAEARVVALLAKDEELLRKFYAGIDVHSEMAYTILGRKWDGKRANKEDRFLGKMGRHARNYDVGKRTFMQQVNAEAKKHGINLNISEFRAGKILEAVKSVTPLVEQVFHEEIKERITHDRHLVNPFGRYRDFFGRWDSELFKEAYATIPQGTVIDHLRKSCFRAKINLDSRQYKWVIEAHDAIVALVRIGYEEEYSKIMSDTLNQPIDFSKCSIKRDELVIPCEVQIGYENLKSLKEYHVGGKAA